MGHALTVLPDGRVLASGGFTNWTDSNSGPGFVVNLNTAQDTTELFDPVSGTWSAGPTMASKRSGHTQTMLGDGRVVIVAGVNGGVQQLTVNTYIWIPSFTNSVQSFDPTTNTLSLLPLIPYPRGFHGATLLGNGTLLVTGGASSIGAWNSAAANNNSALFDPATGLWNGNMNVLPTGVAFHTQTVTPSGNALVVGGYVGDFASLRERRDHVARRRDRDRARAARRPPGAAGDAVRDRGPRRGRAARRHDAGHRRLRGLPGRRVQHRRAAHRAVGTRVTS